MKLAKLITVLSIGMIGVTHYHWVAEVRLIPADGIALAAIFPAWPTILPSHPTWILLHVSLFF